ncbi:hypothetical protein [Dysosmobacter acutus]|nr:hypothetical protein [Dysosmobacter acutus]
MGEALKNAGGQKNNTGYILTAQVGGFIIKQAKRQMFWREHLFF